MKTITLECKLTYSDNGKIYSESYRLNGRLHNPNGVAFKIWYDNGQIAREEYFIDGKRHNPNGVSLKSWHSNGQIWSEGYWIDGKLHNENGIALKSWYTSGKKDLEEYYMYGKLLNKEKFNTVSNTKLINAFVKSNCCDSSWYRLFDHKSLSLWDKIVRKATFTPKFRDKIIKIDGVKYKLKAI